MPEEQLTSRISSSSAHKSMLHSLTHTQTPPIALTQPQLLCSFLPTSPSGPGPSFPLACLQILGPSSFFAIFAFWQLIKNTTHSAPAPLLCSPPPLAVAYVCVAFSTICVTLLSLSLSLWLLLLLVFTLCLSSCDSCPISLSARELSKNFSVSSQIKPAGSAVWLSVCMSASLPVRLSLCLPCCCADK